MSGTEAIFDPMFEQYEVRADADALFAGAGAEGTNTSRYTIAGLLTASHRNAAWEVLHEALDFGFDQEPFQQLRPGVDVPREAEVDRLARYIADVGVEALALTAWHQLNQGDLSARLAFLVAGMCRPSERESVAGAIGILDRPDAEVVSPPCADSGPALESGSWWYPDLALRAALADPFDDESRVPWDGEGWRRFSTAWVESTAQSGRLSEVVTWLASIRLVLARQSDDPVTREFAAAFGARGTDAENEDASGVPRNVTPVSPAGNGQLISTLVHGTWAWKGEWWYPGGDFHDYAGELRPQLYGGGRAFGWSGRFKDGDREIAGARFHDWIMDPSTTPVGVRTAFAHSYGGEVAARAINAGAPIQQLVLLSVPATPHVMAALDVVDVTVDVRLKWDLVLGLAGRGQRLPNHPKVRSFVIEDPFWRHGVTHSPQLWRAEQIAERAELVP